MECIYEATIKIKVSEKIDGKFATDDEIKEEVDNYFKKLISRDFNDDANTVHQLDIESNIEFIKEDK